MNIRFKLSQRDIRYEEAAQAVAAWTADGNYHMAEKILLQSKSILQEVMDLSPPDSLYRGLVCKDKNTEHLRYLEENEQIIAPAPSTLVSWTSKPSVAAIYAGNGGVVVRLDEKPDIIVGPPERTLPWFEDLIKSFTKNYELRQKHHEYILQHDNAIQQVIYRSSINKPPAKKEPMKEIGIAVHKSTGAKTKFFGFDNDKIIIQHPLTGEIVKAPKILWNF